MLLSELFEFLRHGELRHMYLGGDETDGIKSEDFPAIVSHINMGLTALHRRFPLKFDEAIIQQYDELQRYYLRYRYAQTNVASTEPIKYIDDSIYKPFKENVLKIEAVYSEYGEEYPLNDRNQTYSVYTPSHDSIDIPFNEKENAVSVIYRANHDKIIVGEVFDPSVIEIDIPASLEEALLFFVANRVLNAMGAGNNIQEANHFLSKYELTCSQIEMYGLIGSTSTTNNRLENLGWV